MGTYLNIVHRNKMAVHIHELNSNFLECSLSEQVSLDSAKSLMGIVISLLNETQLLTLGLVKSALHTVSLLETLKRKNKEFGVVFVVERREGNRSEFTAFEPVNSGCVDSHSLLSGDVGTILEVVVLSLLFCLEPETGESSKILLANGLIDSGTTLDSFSVVVSHICPPISLGFDITENHVLHRCGESRDLPRNVGLPATPCLTEMLQDDTGLVGTNTLRHHVKNIVKHSSVQLQVELRLNSLLGHSLGNTLGLSSLELSGKQVAKPSLKKRDNTTQEEDPHTPHGSPETTTGTLSNGTSVETVVDEMLQILAHTDLSHQTVLVPVHSSQLTNVGKSILETVSKLVGLNISKTVLKES